MSLAVSRAQSYMYDEITSIHVFKNITTQIEVDVPVAVIDGPWNDPNQAEEGLGIELRTCIVCC